MKRVPLDALGRLPAPGGPPEPCASITPFRVNKPVQRSMRIQLSTHVPGPGWTKPRWRTVGPRGWSGRWRSVISPVQPTFAPLFQVSSQRRRSGISCRYYCRHFPIPLSQTAEPATLLREPRGVAYGLPSYRCGIQGICGFVGG